MSHQPVTKQKDLHSMVLFYNIKWPWQELTKLVNIYMVNSMKS